MSNDPTTSTITLARDSSSTFLADSGAHFVMILRDLALLPDAPPQVIHDWRAIENWLGCTGRNLTTADLDRIGLVFRSYLATSVAPSRELVETFRSFSQQAKREGWKVVPVPRSVVGVFDRLMASDAAIQQRRADAEMVVQFAAAMDSLTPRKDAKPLRLSMSRNRQLVRTLSAPQRAFVGLFMGWVAYVVVRTSGRYEFIGFRLHEWDSSYLFANMLIPPTSVAAAAFLYKWVKRGIR